LLHQTSNQTTGKKLSAQCHHRSSYSFLHSQLVINYVIFSRPY